MFYKRTNATGVLTLMSQIRNENGAKMSDKKIMMNTLLTKHVHFDLYFIYMLIR